MLNQSKRERKLELFLGDETAIIKAFVLLMSTLKSENQLFLSGAEAKSSKNILKSKFQEKEKLIELEDKLKKSTKSVDISCQRMDWS